MKFTKPTILTGSFLLLFPLTGADKKLVNKDHFLSINPNIKNEELHAEIEIMTKDFNTERQRIQDYYTKQIEKLKEKRVIEVRTLKKEFGEKREILLRQYEEDLKPLYSKPDRSNIPNKKIGKDKKSLQKPK